MKYWNGVVNSTDVKLFDYSKYVATKGEPAACLVPLENQKINTDTAIEPHPNKPQRQAEVITRQGDLNSFEFEDEYFFSLSEREVQDVSAEIRYSRLLAPNISSCIYSIRSELINEEPFDVEGFSAVASELIATFSDHLPEKSESLIKSALICVLGRLRELEEERFGSPAYQKKRCIALDTLSLLEDLIKLETSKVALRNDVLDFMGRIKFDPPQLKNQFEIIFLTGCSNTFKNWLRGGSSEVSTKISEIEENFTLALSAINLTQPMGPRVRGEIQVFAQKLIGTYEHLSLVVQ